MVDVQQQLAELRRRIAVIRSKPHSGALATPPAGPWPPVETDSPPLPDQAQASREDRPSRYFVEDLVSGSVVRTACGEHFETERLWQRNRRHGSISIADLPDLPADLLVPLTGSPMAAPPVRWAFLDTETTGLAGAAGTYAFLVGVGSIEEKGFRLRQFFMREQREEASLLHRLSEYLGQFDVLITYNGKVYDQPLLEARYRTLRAQSPFRRMEHLDLLFGARRLWKLRMESCRLVELENRILGVERQGDLPGELIPYYYFEYLRTRQAFQLVPIFHHNAMDILSLACLTAIVPFAFRAPETAMLRHGSDLIGLARWLAQADRNDEALRLLRRAVDLGLPDGLLFRVLWDIASLQKKLGREGAALDAWTELSSSRNPYRARAFEEIAKHHEYRSRNYAVALEMTRGALELAETPRLRRREERLLAKLERHKKTARRSGKIGASR